MTDIDVNLDLPPERRWDHLGAWRDSAAKLVDFYLRDLGGMESLGPTLMEYAHAFVPPEYLLEMRGVARAIGVAEDRVVAANLYYDAMKVVLSSPSLGCTGFVVDTDSGPLHARNLDWSTAEGLLASETVVVSFRRASGPALYRTVGWPGFIGCFSGVATERFAVTLNAAMSEDPPELSAPICLVLRQTLETAQSFADAVAALRRVELASDSLLLVSGVGAGQMAVIERSPRRAAVRGPEAQAVVVTNHYRALAAGGDTTVAGNALAETSCARYDRAEQLVRSSRPRDSAACLAILSDPGVRMASTVQQMVLSASTGEVTVELAPCAGAARGA